MGHVRAEDAGRLVQELEYQAHETMAEAQIERLVAGARARWDVGSVAVRHRLGTLRVGEVSAVVGRGPPPGGRV